MQQINREELKQAQMAGGDSYIYSGPRHHGPAPTSSAPTANDEVSG